MTLPRRTRLFLAAVVLLAFLCAVCYAFALLSRPHGRDQRHLVVRHLQLADLSLWYEAMHTRHPSQADLFAPFGDFPGAPEHFPSGSMAPPARDGGFSMMNLEADR